ncbi:MAG: ADP-ribosylglycohydrolase family protein [Spirochaetaceae bacterium]|jgi:ADP-ribosylglycohydrolase|nr:ADP-ribosylglycohydrolase family protein [Spirochaetaceae bacterium]
MDRLDAVQGLLFGAAVGDALGVPAEFAPREALKKNPVTDFTGGGVHNQPPGTFSDDASLLFCLAEALIQGFDTGIMGKNFVKWMGEGYWAAAGTVFDIGGATLRAIRAIAQGVEPELAGGAGENDNGNGSLMRIAPLVFYSYNKPARERFDAARKVSSLTHRHIRSVIACFYYLEFMSRAFEGKALKDIYADLKTSLPLALTPLIDPAELAAFDRLLKDDIASLPETAIQSGGYAVHTLEAALWCVLTTAGYKDAVLKAVNLGGDADTAGCVAGALAGLYYGYPAIPRAWVQGILKRDEIAGLGRRLYKAFFHKP